MSNRLWRTATGRWRQPVGRQQPSSPADSSARAPARRGRGTRGQAVVEFALILPVFLLLLVIAVDFGRLFFSYIQINNAAREGAAYGLHLPTDCGGNPCLATSGIATHARQETNAQGQRGEAATGIVVSATCANPAGTTIPCTSATGGGTGAGNTITVNVNESFTFLTPLISGAFGGSLQMNASATAPITDYAAGTGGTPPGGCSLPTSSFVVTVTSGLTVFADPAASTPNSGVCNISGYNWDWGDGNQEPGSASGLSHTYALAGTWTIILEVTNQAGPNQSSNPITVPVGPPPPTCAKPTANFTWTTAGNGANKVYTYKDASTVADPVNCPVTDWLWTFTDNGGNQSNAQNPAPFSYGNNSSHSVTLKVTNAGGSSTITKST
jgi:Flp pilus assembly protein TadG